MVYSMCQNLVAGQTSTFSVGLFVKGLLLSAPIIVELSGLFLIFYLIRHPSDSYLPLITYLILGVLAWFVIVPSLFKIQNAFVSSEALQEPRNKISAGYFRNIEDHVVFFSRVTDEGVADGIVLDVGVDGKNLFTFKDAHTITREEGFQDSIISDSVSANFFMQHIINGITNLESLQALTIALGYLHWITVASLGLALLSIVGLRNISEWRLLDVLIVFIAYMLVLIINITLNLEGFALAKVAFKINTIFKALSFLTNPTQVILNLAFSIIMLVSGILIDGNDRKRRLRGGEL